MTLLQKVFIVPYRDRVAFKKTFLEKMQREILLDEPLGSYEIYFAHQCDKRPFNRGAMKNIGFLALKQKYPHTYKNLTFIFNDVDVWPVKKGLIHYNATAGVVNHFFGYKFSLGGIFAIKGEDFEKARGFPNFWGWGLEDNVMQERCLAAGLKIDRSCFYPITDNVNIIRPFDGFIRLMSQRDAVVYNDETPDDLTQIKNIRLAIDANKFINVTFFTCMMDPDEQVYKNYDIRRGAVIATAKGYSRRVWNMKKMFSSK